MRRTLSSMNHRGVRLFGLACLLLTLAAGPLPAGAVAPDLDPGDGSFLRRWFGAEAGFDEVACLGLGNDCDGMSVEGGFGGQIAARDSMLDFQDPDGVIRPFPARTGRRLWLAAAPGADASFAYLSTSGSMYGPFDGGTVTFSFRVPVLPALPIVIYQHEDPDPLKMLTLTLTPQGEILVMVGLGTQGVSKGRVQPFQWHSLTLSYGPDLDAFRMWFDGTLDIDRSLKEGGPGGHVKLGIVSPTGIRFAIGLDDYVESIEPDAPILGARINYLIPEGQGGKREWDKIAYSPQACFDLAENWQLVSEDHRYSAADGSLACSFDGYAIGTSSPDRVDEYKLEGVPSTHQSNSLYPRDVTLQPRLGDQILAVRPRMGGATSGPPLTWSLAVSEGGAVLEDSFTFGGTQAYQLWGRSHELRPTGGEWTLAALDKAKLRLESGGTGLLLRRVTAVRLDYVWVPGFYTGG